MFLNSLAPILPHKLLSKIDTPAAKALDFTPHLVKLPGTYSQKEAASIALTMFTAPIGSYPLLNYSGVVLFYQILGNMFCHLLWCFIKAVLNPLENDTKIAINKIRHQIGEIFVPSLPIGHQQFTGPHNDHLISASARHSFIKAAWFRSTLS